MIAYVPTMYPDETVYSLLTRIYEKSGYLSYAHAKNDFFVNPKEGIEFLFLNKLSKELIDIITRNQTLDDVIKNHTLYNYYGRYLGAEKRKDAYNSLCNMTGDYFRIFVLNKKSSEETYLRYCPMCASEDKHIYGETYWKRTHQIPELEVCPAHGCKLLNSNVSNNKHSAMSFTSANTAVKDLTIIHGSEQDIKLAEYIGASVRENIEYDDDLLIGKYLTSKLEGTKYLSSCGNGINRKLLFQDLTNFYSGCKYVIQETNHLSKIFHGKRIKPFEIIQIAMFLKIPYNELVNAQNPDKTPSEKFEQKVINMLRDRTMEEVSSKLNISKSAIKIIIRKHNGVADNYTKYEIQECRKIWTDTIKEYPNCSFREICMYSKYRLSLQWLRRNDKEWTDKHYPRKQINSVRQQNIDLLDKKYLSQIENVIQKYREHPGEMPKRITINAIGNYIGIPGRQLYYMKQCRAVIEKYAETDEEFRVRKILWAVDMLQRDNKKLNFNQIRKLTHIHSGHYYKSRPLLIDTIGEETVLRIDPNTSIVS